MMLRNELGNDYVLSSVWLVLAALFIYAGAIKFRDPLQFADTIAAFAILPQALINVLALSLPPFEVACGLLLVVPQTMKDWGVGCGRHLRDLFLRAILRAGSRSRARLRLLR
jgi:hypothetical protein